VCRRTYEDSCFFYNELQINITNMIDAIMSILVLTIVGGIMNWFFRKNAKGDIEAINTDFDFYAIQLKNCPSSKFEIKNGLDIDFIYKLLNDKKEDLQYQIDSLKMENNNIILSGSQPTGHVTVLFASIIYIESFYVVIHTKNLALGSTIKMFSNKINKMIAKSIGI